MGDFSSVTVSNEFPLPSGAGHRALYFQTKDLPDDPGYGACIGGAIEKDGLFVRTDSNERLWNPELSGWALTSVGVRADFAARFVEGRAIEVKGSEDVSYEDIGSFLEL